MTFKFVLLGLLLSNLAYGQDFRKLVRKADSLKYYKKNDEAIKYYDRAIDSVLYGKQKENVSDDEWFEILNSAGTIIGGKNKYWNLAYGSRAEKLSEKVTELQDMGIKHVFSFEVKVLADNVERSHSNECYGGNKHMLVWLANNFICMQAFDACNTYKNVKIQNTAVADLVKNNYDQIVSEQVQKLFYNTSSSRTEYQFTYYINNQTIKSNWVDVGLFSDPRGRYNISPNTDPRNGIIKEVEKFNQNKSTKFCRLFLQLLKCEKEYNDRTDSGAERAKVGKL